MCEQRTSIPVPFTGLKREHAGKNPVNPVLAGPPKAGVTGSNPVGCTIFRHFCDLCDPSQEGLCELCASNGAAVLAESRTANGDNLQSYRALRLIQVHAVRPGLAIVLADLAFDGGHA